MCMPVIFYTLFKELHQGFTKPRREETFRLDKTINEVATNQILNRVPPDLAAEAPSLDVNVKVGFASQYNINSNTMEIAGSLPPDGFEDLDVTTMKFGKCLGNGCNGSVTIATFNDGKEFVQKSPLIVVLDTDVYMLGLDNLENEAKITKFLTRENHPNIIKYIGSKEYMQKVSEDQNHTIRSGCLVLEKAQGDFTHFLNEKHPLKRF